MRFSLSLFASSIIFCLFHIIIMIILFLALGVKLEVLGVETRLYLIRVEGFKFRVWG